MTDFAIDDAMTARPRSRRWLYALLPLILLLLGAPLGLRDQRQEAGSPSPIRPAGASQVKPPTPPPIVEPLIVRAVKPQNARLINASVPFSSLPNPAARPFRLKVADLDFGRATDCLAAAQWYEAGDDVPGQRAVAQVVLNRARHPAFPATVCGVVFQGAERATGCQFTFTCDGALARTPSAAAWERARAVAREALSGSVFGKVGTATHYHTDWVVPYWSSSLDKVTAVGTHLFFRWKGWWGTPAAFKTARPGKEPRIALIARLSQAHATPAMDDPKEPLVQQSPIGPPRNFAGPVKPVSAGQRFGTAEVVAVSEDGSSFILALDRSSSPQNYEAQALKLCGGRQRCRVLGWTDGARTPGGFPVMDSLLKAMAYSYMRDRNLVRSLWNCDQHPRSISSQCMVDRDPAKLASGTTHLEPAVQLRPEYGSAAPPRASLAATVPGSAALAGK